MSSIQHWIYEQNQSPSIHVDHPKSKPRALINAALDNLRTINAVSPASAEVLDHWVRKQYYVLRPVFRKRTEMGYVKDFNGFVKDTQHHLAQKALDYLEAHLQQSVYQLINEYLKFSGDYLGLSVFPFYKVMASMNRAVLALESDDLPMFYYWIHIACNVVNAPKPVVYLVSGLNANHRLSLAKSISNHFGAIHLNTLDERYRLFGLDEQSEIDYDKVFSPEANQLLFHQMTFLSEKILKAQFPVVLDGRFLKKANRQAFVGLAQQSNSKFIHFASIDPSLIYQDETLKSDIDDYEVGENAFEFEEFGANTEQRLFQYLEEKAWTQ